MESFIVLRDRRQIALKGRWPIARRVIRKHLSDLAAERVAEECSTDEGTNHRNGGEPGLRFADHEKLGRDDVGGHRTTAPFGGNRDEPADFVELCVMPPLFRADR